MRTIWIQVSGVYLVMWAVLCFQFYTHRSLKHSKASRYFQSINCIFLFTIYAPQSPALLPKWRLMQVHVRIFTAQRYTIRNQGCNCKCLKQGIKLMVWLPSTLVQPLLPHKFCQWTLHGWDQPPFGYWWEIRVTGIHFNLGTANGLAASNGCSDISFSPITLGWCC